MAILYKANETDFNHLGLGPLNDAVSILVTEERNGMFELEMRYPIEGSRFVDLKLDRMIKADAGYNLKNQRFKIIRITKPIDGIVTVNAEHVSYLTQDLALKPSVNYSGSASQALSTWKSSIVDDNPFIVSSDITTTGSGSWSITDVKNAREALGGVKGSLLETYGGEFRFDNYHVRLMAQRGVNSGALIAYGRNLTDFTQEESIADTFTSVYPYSVYQDKNNKEVLLTLPEYFVDSEYVNNYARRKILPVDFSDEEIKDVTTLRNRAKSYVKANGIGIPKVNMKIKYIDLAKTLDYKDLAVLEEVNLCDNVSIYFEQLGVNTTAKIIKTVWDDLLEQYDSIEVGEAKSSLSNSINTTVDGKIETIAKQVNTIQLTADGLNVINRGIEEPSPGKVGDLWYQPDGIYTNMYQWDGVIWKLVLSTRNLDTVEKEVTAAVAEIEEVKQSADDAVTKADTAIEEAGFAKFDAATAKQNAVTAIENANEAKTNAGTALTTAQTAVSNSGAAISTANNALDAYNSLEIGGRNLIPYSGGGPQSNSGWTINGDGTLSVTKHSFWKESTENIFKLTNLSTSMEVTASSSRFFIQPNTEYTFSFWVFHDSNLTDFDIYLLGRAKGETASYTMTLGNTSNTASPLRATLFTWTFTTPSNIESAYIRIDHNGRKNLDNSSSIYFTDAQIKRGTKVQDWTPNPEDIQVQITTINGELNRKVSQTNFDTLNGTVQNQSTSISQSQIAIGLKADKSVVDVLSGTVSSHSTLIEQNAETITSKAESSVVDTLKGTVAGHTTSISQNATAITSKADKSVVNTLSGTVTSQGTLLSQTAEGLKSKAEASDVNTLSGTVSNHTTLIEQNASAISARLTETQVNNLLGTKNYVNQTTLTATANGLSGQITQVSTDLSNLDFDGRNILRNTRNMTNFDYWNMHQNDKFKIIKHDFYNKGTENMFVLGNQTTVETYIGTSRYTVIPSERYTFSMRVFNNVYLTSFDVYFLGRETGSTELFTKTIAKMNNKASAGGLDYFEWTFTVPEGITEGYIRIDNNGTTNTAYSADLYFVEMKLQKGKKTGWSAAPEDLATLERVVTIEANINGLQATVANKADSSQVTQLANQWTQTTALANGHTGQIANLGEQINLRVTASQVTEAILTDKTIKDTRSTNQSPQWYYDNYPKNTVKEFKTRSVIGVPGSSIFVHVTTEVPWVDSSGGSVIQISESLDGTYRRTGSGASWGAWTLLVDASNLISQINVQSGRILIQTGKLYLDADTVTFSGKAFIPSASIVDLNADKITAGTLNASNVAIINLDANSIVTGTISGANSSWNLNTGRMNFKNPSTGDDLVFTQGQIEFQNGNQGRLLKYNAEGLFLEPMSGNTGTSLNTSIHLNGGVDYIQFNNRLGTTKFGRLEVGTNSAKIEIPVGAEFRVVDVNNVQAPITANYFKTVHSSGYFLTIQQDRIYTIGDGIARNIYLEPNGTGSVVAGNRVGARWNVVASDFVKQSTRESKTDIKPIETKGLDVIGRLNPVSYKKKDKVNDGIIETELGFIAEDSLEVATPDVSGIYDSHITAYLVKAMQELHEEVKKLKGEIQ